MAPPSLSRSNNMRKIDRLIEALGNTRKTQSAPSDGSNHSSYSSRGLLSSSLTSSLQSVMLNFGIFDSLTLDNENLRRMKTNKDSYEEDLEDTRTTGTIEDEDDDSSWPEFNTRYGCQRSGVRRGHQSQQQQKKENPSHQFPEAIMVLTKFSDGPSNGSVCISNLDETSPKQRCPRAA